MGYVGLPLAVAFSKKLNVVGFDINKKRISDLNKGFDQTLEIKSKQMLQSKKLVFIDSEDGLRDCNCYIITVPTPITKLNKPDFSHLVSASKLVGSVLKKKRYNYLRINSLSRSYRGSLCSNLGEKF